MCPATYKLHAWTFRGKRDDDLQSHQINIVMTQKWVNLMSVLIENFKGKGQCVAVDSTYMGDIMAQIGCEGWQLNMVGTVQSNQMVAEVKDVLNKMKARMYKSCF
jgi:hypothetical protein